MKRQTVKRQQKARPYLLMILQVSEVEIQGLRSQQFKHHAIMPIKRERCLQEVMFSYRYQIASAVFTAQVFLNNIATHVHSEGGCVAARISPVESPDAVALLEAQRVVVQVQDFDGDCVVVATRVLREKHLRVRQMQSHKTCIEVLCREFSGHRMDDRATHRSFYQNRRLSFPNQLHEFVSVRQQRHSLLRLETPIVVRVRSRPCKQCLLQTKSL